RASGTSLVEVSNVTSRGAHRRLSPVRRPRPRGSELNSAGRMAPKTSNVATTSAPPVIASILTAESGLAICPSIVMSNFPSAEKTRELIFHEHEAGGQNERIGRHREALEAHGPPPRQQDRKDDGECDDLPDFDPDVEADHVRHEPVRVQPQRLQLGGKPKSVDQAEAGDGHLVVRLHAENRLEAAEVVEGLVDYGQADDGVDQEGIDVELE